jgi:ketosteroid isomerase-like protein
MIAGDAEGYMSQWHRDGIQIPPDGPIVYGWDAIDSGTRDVMSRLDFSVFDVQPHEIRLTSDKTAYSWGECPIKFVSKATCDVTVLDGKFLSILIKETDGSWKILRDCYNLIPRQGDA